jgi:succinate dehydrogenase (ubiquinone) cytochrome b560 subunit
VPNAGFSAPAESYTEKQAKKGRPVSPHVTIYRFPMSAISSITNRVTGVGLTVGLTGMAGMALVGVDPSIVMQSIGNSAVGVPARALVCFPLLYHYLGGVRHIVWDKVPEKTLNNEDVEKSSYMLFAASGVGSLAAAMITI